MTYPIPGTPTRHTIGADRGDDWREQASCATGDPEVFYPEKGQTPRAAQGICDDCPVALTCLTEGWDVPHGVRAGIGEGERKRLRQTGVTPAQALARHRAKRAAEIERQRIRAYLKTHYKCGHLKIPENAYTTDSNNRCKPCSRVSDRERQRQKRAAA